MQAEALILLLNLLMVMLTYLFVYPRFAGRDLNKLLINDLAAMVISLLVVGSLFQGRELKLSLIIFDTNWFWFCLLSYMLIETPFALRYIKKHKLFE